MTPLESHVPDVHSYAGVPAVVAVPFWLRGFLNRVLVRQVDGPVGETFTVEVFSYPPDGTGASDSAIPEQPLDSFLILPPFANSPPGLLASYFSSGSGQPFHNQVKDSQGRHVYDTAVSHNLYVRITPPNTSHTREYTVTLAGYSPSLN